MFILNLNYLQYIDNINAHLVIYLLLILINYKAQRTPGTPRTPVFDTLGQNRKTYFVRLFHGNFVKIICPFL